MELQTITQTYTYNQSHRNTDFYKLENRHTPMTNHTDIQLQTTTQIYSYKQPYIHTAAKNTDTQLEHPHRHSNKKPHRHTAKNNDTSTQLACTQSHYSCICLAFLCEENYELSDLLCLYKLMLKLHSCLACVGMQCIS